MRQLKIKKKGIVELEFKFKLTKLKTNMILLITVSNIR